MQKIETPQPILKNNLVGDNSDLVYSNTENTETIDFSFCHESPQFDPNQSVLKGEFFQENRPFEIQLHPMEAEYDTTENSPIGVWTDNDASASPLL